MVTLDVIVCIKKWNILFCYDSSVPHDLSTSLTMYVQILGHSSFASWFLRINSTYKFISHLKMCE